MIQEEFEEAAEENAEQNAEKSSTLQLLKFTNNRIIPTTGQKIQNPCITQKYHN
jgi:hypothetical protein